MASPTRNCKGYTLLALLFLIAGFGIAMAALGTLWHTHVQREKEAELLFVGDQYRLAIEHYYRLTPGTAKHYPPSLEVLLLDPRFPTTVRHLRRLYRDPITGNLEWGLVKTPDGGISGVHSLSEKEPRKKVGFSAAQADFEGKDKYADWIFKALPLAPAAAAGPGETVR